MKEVSRVKHICSGGQGENKSLTRKYRGFDLKFFFLEMFYFLSLTWDCIILTFFFYFFFLTHLFFSSLLGEGGVSRLVSITQSEGLYLEKTVRYSAMVSEMCFSFFIRGNLMTHTLISL